MDKIFKQLYPGVKEEYLERAFEKLKTWFVSLLCFQISPEW